MAKAEPQKGLLDDRGLDRYVKILQFASSISRLYSDNDSAYINYRLVEQAFVRVSGARDLSRMDVSFDALSPSGEGVGVKTFLGGKAPSRLEKVAEFTNQAAKGTFSGLSHEEKAFAVGNLRNSRIQSDARELTIDESLAKYHCVVRVHGQGFIHEEAMPLVDLEKIRPTTSTGKPIAKFPKNESGHVYFADSNSQYKYDVSKNTLFKRFDFSTGLNSERFDLPIREDIWDVLLRGEFDVLGEKSLDGESPIATPNGPSESVVLPLYSTAPGTYGKVLPKSGINQWNAGGRARKFGEAYIPVPSDVRKLAPNFFPDRDTPFRLALPNGKIVSAKICQADGKALMADPNVELLEWLYAILDGNQNRMLDRLRTRSPYTNADLIRVDRDSVIVEKSDEPGVDYSIRTAAIGSYERFVQEDC